jgi:hypothetical protein
VASLKWIKDRDALRLQIGEGPEAAAIIFRDFNVGLPNGRLDPAYAEWIPPLPWYANYRTKQGGQGAMRSFSLTKLKTELEKRVGDW